MLIAIGIAILLLFMISGSPLAWVIAVVFAGIIVATCVELYKKGKDNEWRVSQQKQQFNAKDMFSFDFIAGLPLAKNLPIELYVCSEKLLISSHTSDNQFELPFSKVISIQSTTAQEAKANNKSAVGRGIVGGLIGGVGGAIIGASSANKTETQNVLYVHIFYTDKSNETSSITLSSLNCESVRKFIYSVSPSIPKVDTVAL